MPSPTDGYFERKGPYINGSYGSDGHVYWEERLQRTAYSERFSRYSLTTPGYHNTHRRFGLPFNKYDYYLIRSTAWQGRKEWGGIGYVQRETGVLYPFSENPDLISSLDEFSAVDEAIGKALNRVKDQSANWAENIATSKQSISMIAGLMTSVLNAYRAARQGNMAKAAAHLGVSLRGPARVRRQSKAIANGWLELQYGWLPLLSDIYETTLAIQKRRQVKAPLIRVSATTMRTSDRTVSSTDGTVAVNYVFTTKMTAKAILYFKLQNEDLRFASQMGITNPLALAWELVPFSFVVDWMLPIGTYLSNFDATLGLVYVKGGCTTFRERKVTGTTFASRVNADGTFKRESTFGGITIIEVHRDPAITVPSNKVPHFKDPTSMKHLANAMALLRQQRH